MVIYMKKLALLISFLLLFLLINIDDDTITVFNEDIEYSNFYEISFINNLSTNNFLDYFSNSKVIWIKPKMNILYEEKLSKYNKYYFKNVSNYKNINTFKNEYIDYINSLGYKNEALKLKTSGIMIERIKVYSNDEELNYIKNSFIDIKIKNL